MTQPNFLDLPARREKIHKRVRPTSRQQYAVAREQFTGRRADVLRWLAAYWNKFNQSPTSAELEQWLFAFNREFCLGADYTTRLLYVRRGLSDLQTTGNVEAAGKRPCRISGRTVETWRVVSR